MKTIIIACGSGIATSTIISSNVSELLEENGIDFDIIQCSLHEIDSYVGMGDLIVASTQLYSNYPIPVVNGLGYISGVGTDEINKSILEVLK